jgi:hypothetical protein
MIKNWILFKESIDDKSKIIELCKKFNIRDYTINDDFSIDVDRDVNLSHWVVRNSGVDKFVEIPLKFRRVNGNFNCSNNYLTSLRGCPEYVGGEFRCNDNLLTSLEFGPIKVDGDYYCYSNNLTSLEFLPNNKYTNCSGNEIFSFKGISDNFMGDIFCKINPISEIWDLFRNPKYIEFLNDCDALREPEEPGGKPIVILSRLNFFLKEIGKEPVENVSGYTNIFFNID